MKRQSQPSSRASTIMTPLESKLLRKRPTTVSELLATAKNYVDADDAKKIIKEMWVGHHAPNTHHAMMTIAMTMVKMIVMGAMTPNFLDNHDRWHDHHNAFRGKRPHEDDHEVNTVKKPSGHRDY
jgi:hypothetical protein